MIHRIFRPRFSDSRSETIWLTVYADMITNLVLVFLALFGLTMMGDDAIREAVLSMKLGDVTVVGDNNLLTEFDAIAEELRQEFVGVPDLSISQDASMARITFGENVLFASGLAGLKESARPVLLEIADYLRPIPYTVIVEGHTDSLPLKKGSQFKTNWELSLSRAMSVVRLLLEEGGLNSEQVAAAAYGAYRSRASNLTVMGRRLNRRVEITILKDFPLASLAEQEGRKDNPVDVGISLMGG